MTLFFWSALGIQGFLMSIDEFYFHWRRDLPKWERIGHPVDTFFFLLPLSVLAFCEPASRWRTVYIVASVISCLVITKDEWVHVEKAHPLEQWLHTLLFMLHPVVLLTGYFVWSESSAPFQWVWGAILTFWFYQILFWNRYADRIFKTRFGNYQQRLLSDTGSKMVSGT